MNTWEGWAFLSLIGCFLFITLSLTVLTDGWAAAGSLAAVALGILAGGLYGLSAGRHR